MSEKLKQCFSMFRRRLLRRGQVAVFYALMVPMIFLLGGVGLDLGWYYLKVSRMQNAADAAVLAGAWKMLGDEESLSDYSDVKFIDFVPSYILKAPDNDNKPILSSRSSATGDAVAKEYVKKNLAVAGSWEGDKIVDDYDRRPKAEGTDTEDPNAEGTPILKNQTLKTPMLKTPMLKTQMLKAPTLKALTLKALTLKALTLKALTLKALTLKALTLEIPD